MYLFKYSLSLLLMLALSATIAVFAQEPKVFPEDPTAFVTELSTFFKSAQDRESRQALQVFSEEWVTGKYDTSIQ